MVDPVALAIDVAFDLALAWGAARHPVTAIPTPLPRGRFLSL